MLINISKYVGYSIMILTCTCPVPLYMLQNQISWLTASLTSFANLQVYFYLLAEFMLTCIKYIIMY